MKRFTIKMPLAGYVEHTVEAETEDEAIQAIFKIEGGVEAFDHSEWDLLTKIVEGNVFRGTLNEMEIETEEIDDLN